MKTRKYSKQSGITRVKGANGRYYLMGKLWIFGDQIYAGCGKTEKEVLKKMRKRKSFLQKTFDLT